MKTRIVSIGVAVALGLAGPAWAKGGGKGHGHGHGHGKPASSMKQSAPGESGSPEFDAQGRLTRPPGLSKKEKMPKGLEQQGKTPEGWTKGKKKGWFKHSDQPAK